MKKYFIFLSFVIICLCAACGKTSKAKSELTEDEWKEIYSYETPFVFSQERVENEVEYIDGMDALVDEAVKTIRNKMQMAHNTGDWYDVWNSENIDFDGKGYYISLVPITTYNNNRNILMDFFTLIIFNENMTVAGEASFYNLNNRKFEVNMVPVSNSVKELKSMPGMEFIGIHAYYLRDNYSANPNLMGGIQPRAQALGLLGEDNKIYAYDTYSDKVKEINKLNLYGGKSFTVEGDVFHSLPEEMRYSYDKIMDNLIWVEYKN